jgi:hypothetical protein
MKNRIGEKASTPTYVTIESLKALLIHNREAFADFLISHGNESLWHNKDAYNWAVEYVENNSL